MAVPEIPAGRAMLAGCLILFAGVAITFGAVATGTAAAFLAGTAVAGVGFGLAFLGAFRMVTALAPPAERAGLVAAIFIVNFLAFSIPAGNRRVGSVVMACTGPPWCTAPWLPPSPRRQRAA